MITCTQRFVGRPAGRRGTVLPFLALTIVVLVSFLALAIDVGMLAVAKAQAQNAADLAALTAARTLNGDSSSVSPNNGSYNQTTATTNAQNILTYNVILGQAIQASQLTLTFGSYDYDQVNQTFVANYPPTSGKPYSATAATVTASSLQVGFSGIFGLQFLPTVAATAQAVHRPRDIALVQDLSGSMRFGTCLGYDFYTSTRTTNNADTAYPTFGHYSSASAGMVGTSSNRTSAYDNYTISPTNTTAGTTSFPLTYVNNFYQNAAYATTLIRAFDSYSSTNGGTTWTAPTTQLPQLPASTYTTTPGGDVPLFKSGSTSVYAQNVNDVVAGTARNASWELDGYSNYTNGSSSNAASGLSNYASAPFYGYTRGPAYYGKTFFVWPPDPRRTLSTSGITWTLASGTSGGTDTTQINQFLLDFGYTAADFNNTAVTTTLNGAITNAVTSLVVNTTTGFPVSPFTPFRIVVGSEILLVTAVSASPYKTWTVTRAKDGTSAAAHATGLAVGLATGPPLYGIYSATTTTGSQAWPWPNDGGVGSGTTLSSYLTTNVYKPGGSTGYLATTDAAYQKIMRLYSWNYVIDNLGTTPCDWRLRFFGTTNNTKLFASTGSLNLPGASTYTINYTEILRWIAASPNPFPQTLRAGRVKYYASIPTSITGSWPSYGGTDQRFWKEYIDYALGLQQTAASTYVDVSAMAGYGSDFNWGTPSVNAAPSSTQYMNYSDIPNRPRLRCWFGPLTVVDYLNNYNMNQNASGYFFMQPGDSYEAPIYPGKQAYLAAVNTMEYNHPNDWFSLIAYSAPRGASDGTIEYSTGRGRFNCVRAPMGTNYDYARAALLFPFSTIKADGSCNNTEVTPYDMDTSNSNRVPSANFVDIPRADGNTCFAMSLMLAYNQFASTPSADALLRTFTTATPIPFPTGMTGGLGRKGAQKVIIFETDGLANTSATATLVSAPTYKYYQIRYDMNNPTGSEYPTVSVATNNDATVLSGVYGLVDQLAADYGTTRNPFRLYAIGFGPVFTGTDGPAAKTTLQTMQFHAGTQSSAATALPSNQIITGTAAQMSANMISAFTSILQNGVQIALIK